MPAQQNLLEHLHPITFLFSWNRGKDYQLKERQKKPSLCFHNLHSLCSYTWDGLSFPFVVSFQFLLAKKNGILMLLDIDNIEWKLLNYRRERHWEENMFLIQHKCFIYIEKTISNTINIEIWYPLLIKKWYGNK